MSRQDIADYLGMSTETVSRNLSDLTRSGVVGLDHVNRVTIHSMPALRHIANGA